MAPTRAEAFRFWLKLGFISFGGPAGQIAIMHREVVERRSWLADGLFMQALNFCLLLPGPEALKLAVWIGWRLHGVAGGIVAGVCFIGPAIAVLMGLSFVYALHGDLPQVAAVLLGLQATVIALIAQALVRLARRALVHPLHWLLAAVALAVMVWRIAPFPLLLALAALVGLLVNRAGDGVSPAPRRQPAPFPWRILAAGLLLILLPAVAILALAGPDTLFADVYRFFTAAALLTFGGAYAILAWVTQQAVEVQAWLTQAQAVAGLALAETTPGPLVIVLQFIGFMAGWNAAAGVDAAAVATVTALLASWATFLPAFVIILVTASYVERLSANRRVAGALAGITAAVVGVIGSLAIVFGHGVLFPGGLASPDWEAIAITLAAFAVLQWTRIDVLWVIASGALAGLLLGMA